jgi:hypothetical protein
MKNPYSAQRRRIHAFAKVWTKAYIGPGPHRWPRIAIPMHTVMEYALNWLAQHGEMPTGVHKCKAVRPIRGLHTTYPVLEVDFTPLHRLASPGSGTDPQPQ